MPQEQLPQTNTPTDKCAKDPAPQPHDPPEKCEPIAVGNQPPCYEEPPKCETCCDCPPVPGDKPGCLEGLIKSEADAINKGEQAKKFKSDLEALLGKVKAATLEYTADSYKDLIERWKKEDDAIVCLIRSIRCALPCWWCVIECELCPLINDIVRLESKLSGVFKSCDEKPAAAPQPAEGCEEQGSEEKKEKCLTSLYDLRQWWWREKLRRQALFDHAANVMRSWETPFKTIDCVLKANAEILKVASGTLGIDQKKDAAKLLFDVFFRLVPQHMAIAPPESAAKTAIANKYVELCCCDNSPVLHECCGVIIRLPTVRDRIIGALPYLIAPDRYPILVCCLATNVYQPAKQSAVEADSKFSEYDTEVKAIEAAIVAQLKSLPADAKVRLGKTIECKDYQSGSDECCDDDDTPPPKPEDCNKQPDPTQTGNPARNANRA
ncbi:MAG TPA: hypothetical protein VGQ22_23690 [Steroidobacteraceae bacterium]|jgi:hypothetical protein|nr:hypothetical protein [Steroidobacteraceae bacterium]